MEQSGETNNALFLNWFTYERLPLLENLESETKNLLNIKALEMGITIKNAIILKGFIFLYLENKANVPVEKIAQGLKGYTSKFLRENHKDLLIHTHLWDTGYYVE